MIDSTLMSTILPCERVAPYGIIFFPYTFHIYPYFLLINQVFKQAVWQRSEAKCSFYIFLYIFKTFSLGKVNDFVLTSLKAANQTFPPSVIFFFKLFLYTNNVNYSVKIKKNNLKNERAHSVSIDFHYPATYSFVSLGIFDNESRDKTLSLLNCTSCKSCISMKQN